MFVSALLLFLVQPMIGKMVLPLLGGTPAVWNTCMVFYQGLLLAGYYYAHKSTSGLAVKKQTTLHAGVMLAALAMLLIGAALTANSSPIPIVKSLSPQGDNYPFFGVIVLLAAAIGLPFFVVSTSAPLLQKWFAETGHPSSRDPYFLYAASNFGSLLALIAYPSIVEPNLRLVWQAWIWAIGYGVLVVLVFMCAKAANKPISHPPPKPQGKAALAKPQAATIEDPPPTLLRQLRWVALGFVPSSLMLGVTTFVSTDMASIPLLWIIPLSLYLITFIIVFAKVPQQVHLTATLLMPVFVLLLVFLMTSKVPAKFGLQLLLHMGTFFVVALVCHGELARDRPSTKHLTHFYLLMSVGGMLGGLFNALFAPIVFTFTSEYPVTLVAACFLLPNLFPERKIGGWTYPFDVMIPAAIFFVCCMLQTHADRLGEYIYDHGKEAVAGLFLFAVPACIAVGLLEKDLRDRIALALLLGVSLIVYAFVGPIASWMQSWQEPRFFAKFMQLIPSEAWRWIAVAVPAVAFALYWKKNTTQEALPRKLGTSFASLGVSFAMMLIFTSMTARDFLTDMAANLNLGKRTVAQITIYGIPAMVCYFFVERPIRFGAAVAGLWLATFYTEYRANEGTFYDRSFFGRLKIDTDTRWKHLPIELFPRHIENDTENYEIETREGESTTTVYFTVKGEAEPTYVKRSVRTETGMQSVYLVRRDHTTLVHGTTTHGLQETERLRRDMSVALWPLGAPNALGAALDVQCGAGNALLFPGRDPTSYYHRTGPVGAMFNAFAARNQAKENANTAVACVGLGTGSLSSYGAPGQKMVFFEIDTHVRSLVEPPRFFSYIDSAKTQGVDLEFAMGDARISLERMNRKFGFMLVDAFSSDAIPAHLLTKEAFELYWQRLEDDGLLAVHISNRYLDLEPVVERLCRELKLEARVMHGSGDVRDELNARRGIGRTDYDEDFWSTFKYAATWIVIAKSKEALGPVETDVAARLAEVDELLKEEIAAGKRFDERARRDFIADRLNKSSDRWIALRGDNTVGLWTDDYSPIIPILRGEWRFWKRSDE
jgi:hypothetical protein